MLPLGVVVLALATAKYAGTGDSNKTAADREQGTNLSLVVPAASKPQKPGLTIIETNKGLPATIVDLARPSTNSPATTTK